MTPARGALALCAVIVACAVPGAQAGTGWTQPRDSHPRWSPDGRTIAFARTWATANEVTNQPLVLMDLATGRMRSVFQLVGVWGFDFAWSPDSSTLAVGQSDRLLAIDVATASARTLADLGVQACCIVDISWSPDGSSVAFAGPTGVAVTSMATAQTRVLAPKGNAAAWAPDSKRLAVAVGRTIDIVSVRTADQERSIMVATRVDEVDWAADGRRIAFAGETGVGYVDLEGAVTRLGDGYGIAWSPDASRLAWSSGRGIAIFELATGQIRRFRSQRQAGGVRVKSWSPDGGRLAFIGDGLCAPGVFVADAAGRHSRRITNSCSIFGKVSLRRANLSVTVWPKGPLRRATHWTLRCGPAGGTIPHPSAACTQLFSFAQPWAPTNGVCPDGWWRGPQLARVRGTFRDRSVWTTFRRSTSCEAARWSAVGKLIPGVRKG